MATTPVSASHSEAQGLYDNAYAETNVYGHARALLEQVGVAPGGVHLDVGCGYGRLAEVLRSELGLAYLGVDLDGEALASLTARGFETSVVDLRDPQALRTVVKQLLGERRLSSISILDTLEHLPESGPILRVLRELAGAGQVPLVVSVPNVAHADIGFKLAFGQWDYTPAGLLDETHVRFFTEERLRQVMGENGWHQTRVNDVFIEESDQHFPRFHPALAEATPLHAVLKALRGSADGAFRVNQFVRAYLPGPDVARPSPDQLERRAPFLTVVMRTQGRRPDTMRDALLCLSAQTDTDFELLVIGHRLDLERQLLVERLIEDTHAEMRRRIRLVRVDHGNRTTPLNVGFGEAAGDYVAILDDDDLVFAHWVETFRKLAGQYPGRVLRSGTVSQKNHRVVLSGGQTAPRAAGSLERYPLEFDFFEHLQGNRSPGTGLAFPRDAFRALGIQFDEDLTTTEDWDFLMRTAAVCGVGNSRAVTCIYRLWLSEESSITLHAAEEWKSNHEQIWRKLDRMPMVLPEGSAGQLRRLFQGARGPAVVESSSLQELRDRAHTILASRSWMLTAPLRWLSRLFGGGPEPTRRLWRLNEGQMEEMVSGLERSTSWRLLAPLRAVAQWFRRLGTRGT